MVVSLVPGLIAQKSSLILTQKFWPTLWAFNGMNWAKQSMGHQRRYETTGYEVTTYQSTISLT